MITMKLSFNVKGASDWMVVNIPDQGFVPRIGDLVRHSLSIDHNDVEIRRRVQDVHRISAANSMNVCVLVILEDEVLSSAVNGGP